MNCHCVLLLKVVVCLSKAIVKTSVCNMNLTMWNLAPALTFRMAPCGRWRLGEKWNKWRSLLQRLTHSVSVIFGHNARTHEDKYLSPPICVGHYNPSNVSSVWRLIRHRQVGTNICWHTHTQKRPDWSLFPNADLGLPTCLSRNQNPQFMEPGGDQFGRRPLFHNTEMFVLYTEIIYLWRP